MVRPPNVLSIAGSDPSGGAGIQADLKTFSALGAYGMAAVTALTAQNTRGVVGVHCVPASFVAQQIETVLADVRVDAIKIGMLAAADIASAVANVLARADVQHIVLDPVMIAKGGRRLLAESAVAVVRERLLSLAFVLTPNLHEAGALLRAQAPASVAEMREAARALHRLGPRFVYLKGGHLDGDSCRDVIFDGDRFVELAAARVRRKNTHGTGCTLSSAITALLPRSSDPIEAMREAKAFVTGAIASSDELAVGSGHGPLQHFHALWHSEMLPASSNSSVSEVS